jgi:hypothetical protein
MSDAHFVEIYRAANSLEAGLLKGALEEAGIPTRVTDESIAALYVPSIWWASPRVLVAEGDAAKAAVILRELEAARRTRSKSGEEHG